MRLAINDRGFAILRFVDALGMPCSLQESSNAERACIWFGRSDHTRMHLDRDMATAALARLRGAPCRSIMAFEDLYGSRCRIADLPADGRGLVEIGVTIDFEGSRAMPMTLGPDQIDLVAPLLLTFVGTGGLRG